MKNNKSLQFIIGVLVIYAAWTLHTNGWFAAAASLLSTGEYSYNGFSGSVTDLFLSAVPLLVDAVSTVGIIALAFFTFLWRLIRPFVIRLAVLLDKKLETYGVDLYEIDADNTPEPEVVDQELDLGELENVLGKILDRVTALEEHRES